MRKAARISEKIVDGVPCDRIEPGLPKNELVADIMAERDPGRRRRLGRLCGHRAAAAVGIRRRRAAPDLGRQAVPEGRGDVLRTFRLLSPLSRAVLPDRFLGHAARRYADAPKPRWSRAWRRGSMRRAPATAPATSPTPWPAPLERAGIRTRRPLRLSDRPVLSARLGRAHHQLPLRGRDDPRSPA